METLKPVPGMKGQSKKEDLFLIDDNDDKHPSVYSTWPKFAIIPLELLRDKTISPTARLVYALYHSYCPQKSMSKESNTFVGQQRLANDLGKSRSFTTRAIAELVQWMDFCYSTWAGKTQYCFAALQEESDHK
jgi:hypothetical protein